MLILCSHVILSLDMALKLHSRALIKLHFDRVKDIIKGSIKFLCLYKSAKTVILLQVTGAAHNGSDVA